MSSIRPPVLPLIPINATCHSKSSATKRSSEKRGSRTTPGRVTTVQQLHFPDKENTVPRCCEPSRRRAFCGHALTAPFRGTNALFSCETGKHAALHELVLLIWGVRRNATPWCSNCSCDIVSRRCSRSRCVHDSALTDACCGSMMARGTARSQRLHNAASRLCGDTLPNH